MKVWQVNDWCEPDGMKLGEVPLPEPGPGQIRIRNRAISVNFFDLLQIQGKYQVKPGFPFTPGAEVSGVVDAVDGAVTAFAKGDRVMAMTVGGSYGEYSLADAYRAFPIPKGLSWNEAASMPIVYHTSWFALVKRAALRAGETLLVHAGASGVGMSAIQIGKALGAKVIATAGEPEKRRFARSQGADFVLDYHEPGWVDRVKELTERRGADVIYDPVGGDIFDLSTRCVAAEGRLLVIGFAGGRIPNIQVNRILLKNMSVVGVFWGDYANSRPWYIRETQNCLEALYTEGKIRPSVGSAYRLSEAPMAMRDIADRKVVGKAVLTVE
ncbi:MAG: NADPH:quinone oxidoreductase family protein [Acidobacteria bacterium]|nr:NADPH:quinone oxidoreductase family protein [Acidobacteriota bacterium]